MPLLHKKAFLRMRPPTNIKLTDKVFYCELSNEIFTDYDEFWERLVLLNALVWSCEYTGRTNLTFKEALESESKAKKFISNIPTPLKIPILYVTTLTKTAKLADLSDDIFAFIRDRYFLHEEIEAIVSNHWYDCKVTDIILPTTEELTKYNKEMEDSDDESVKSIPIDKDPLALNGIHDANSDDDIVILRDDHRNKKIEQILMEKELENKLKGECEPYPPYGSIKYEVEEIEPWDRKQVKRHLVTWHQIRRQKGIFTRDKCKVFLKGCVGMDSNGYLIVKEGLMKKFHLAAMEYTDMFVGIPPKYATSKPKFLPKTSPISEKKNDQKKVKKKDNTSEDENKNHKPLEKKSHKNQEKKSPKVVDKKSPKIGEKKSPKLADRKDSSKVPEKKSSKDLAPIFLQKDDPKKENVKTEQEKLEEKERMKEELRLKMELLRAERKRKKDLEREEKWLMALCMSEWNSVREDLECGDHKDLPSPKPVQCRIPQENFGDFLKVLEFLNAFSELLELKDVYPYGITFDMLEHSVVEKEVAGIFNDILQLLLGAIFSLQEEEEEEIQADNSVDTGNLDLEAHLESKDLKDAVSVANKVSIYCQQYLSIPLQKAPLDALTLTEILRLHLLSSGATNVTNAAWRMLNRGGYRSTDDPGLQFKVDEPKLIKELALISVFDMAIGDKMKILNVLISQILTYASVRDSTDEKVDKLKELHSALRMHKFAENRKDKEEKNLKKQKLKEEKQRANLKKVDPQMASVPNSNLTNGEVNGNVAPEVNGDENQDESITEEERLAIEEKEARNRERRKQESQKKEKSLTDQIAKLNRGVCQLPLGQDRAHRRFWLLTSVPAFFVEDGYGQIGTCLEKPTPRGEKPPTENEQLKVQLAAFASKSLDMKEKEKSHIDKENIGGDKTRKINLAAPAKKLLKETDDNISVNNVTKDININQNRNATKNSVNPSTTIEFDIDSFLNSINLSTYVSDQNDEAVFGLCSGDNNLCCVHSNYVNRPKWSFYSDNSELESLINSLNDRGIRESELKENLLANKDAIEEALKYCPAYKMDPSLDPDLSISQRKSHRGSQQSSSPNLNFAPNTPIPKILELTLRDMILEIEEKIDNGMLGCLKVPERDTWRISVQEGVLISSIIPNEIDWGGRKRIMELKANLGVEINEDEADPLESAADATSAEGQSFKDLAICTLMVGQALDLKYLKAPLADSDKHQKARQKLENRMARIIKDSKGDEQDSSSSEDEDESFDEKKKQLKSISDNSLRTPFERWEKSHMNSTGLSQLYLHLALLVNSITWSRSALNARCCICRRKSDPENMLLCDECDRGHHIYCLKPKLKSIPLGDWFCDKCKPKEKPRTPRKNRKIYKEESDDEFEEEEQSDEEEDEESEVENMEYCFACEMGGELICCDTCPRSFHSECLEMRKIPRGSWSCPLCRDENAKAQNKRRNHGASNENSKGGKKRTFDKVEEEPYHKPIVETLLNDLVSHRSSWPFNKPVYRVDYPDYYTKIKKPMDFRTMKNRMSRDKYTSDQEFIADVLLIFQNCQQYYKDNSPECKAANTLSKYFWSKVEKLGLHSPEQPTKAPAKKRKR